MLKPSPDKLTEDERQNLLLIAGGYDNERISERLNPAIPTMSRRWRGLWTR